MTTVFERHRCADVSGLLPALDVAVRPEDDLPETLRRRTPLRIPAVSEPELVRHYTALSKLNYGVDDGFYPLGSCTMKYNPKLHEQIAALPGFAALHPSAADDDAQGVLAVLHGLSVLLAGIAGLPEVCLQPAAGAHGEFTGLLLIKRYFEQRGELQRTRILLPDSAHGTNPASAALAGFTTVSVPTRDDGQVDIDAVRAALDDTVAGIMLTVPNTLGLFEQQILDITESIHAAGGLCYFDGANLNAFIGRARPGDMGADVFHFNLHKTLSTPHGGGGPGAGPIAAAAPLGAYLPVPRVRHTEGSYRLDWDAPQSIGAVHAYYGNTAVALKAYAYLLALGDRGLKAISDNACLNANYLLALLRDHFTVPYPGRCKHEFVLSGRGVGAEITTVDIAKRLMDFGFHPPTVYFPLIVPEALMIEPTETEGRATLDRFAEALIAIAHEAKEDPERLRRAPTTTPVGRLDQTRAAREPVLRYPVDGCAA
jgi:glycine dehydrogenase subunit 2